MCAREGQQAYSKREVNELRRQKNFKLAYRNNSVMVFMQRRNTFAKSMKE